VAPGVAMGRPTGPWAEKRGCTETDPGGGGPQWARGTTGPHGGTTEEHARFIDRNKYRECVRCIVAWTVEGVAFPSRDGRGEVRHAVPAVPKGGGATVVVAGRRIGAQCRGVVWPMRTNPPEIQQRRSGQKGSARGECGKGP